MMPAFPTPAPERMPKTEIHRSRITSLVLALALALVLAACGRDDPELEDGRDAQELYETAKRSLDSGAWDRAILGYKRLNTRFPFGRFTEQAQLELAYAYYKANEPENAISTLDRFIRTYPTHPNVDYAYYLKGLVNYDENVGFLERLLPGRVRDRDQTAARDSFNDFNELLRRFPESRYAPEARQRLLYLRTNLAAYEIEVGEYYLRRKAYVAAANRGRYVLETYPGTPQNAEALVIMEKAYRALDMPELADDARRVLAVNYPEHPHLTGKDDGEGFFAKLWPFG